MPGQLFVISAPSGAGKSTILMAVSQRVTGLGYSISHTTRKPRGDERNGVDYHFVDDEIFTKMIDLSNVSKYASIGASKARIKTVINASGEATPNGDVIVELGNMIDGEFVEIGADTIHMANTFEKRDIEDNIISPAYNDYNSFIAAIGNDEEIEALITTIINR